MRCNSRLPACSSTELAATMAAAGAGVRWAYHPVLPPVMQIPFGGAGFSPQRGDGLGVWRSQQGRMLHYSVVYLNLQMHVAWSRSMYHASHSSRRACQPSGECWRVCAQLPYGQKCWNGNVAMPTQMLFPICASLKRRQRVGFARELGLALGV